jgi:hypothetical protein
VLLAFRHTLRRRRRDPAEVTVFAPRISPALIKALVELDDRDLPIAETNRRLGEEAERLGLRRPSYQRVRELVHELRDLQRNRGPTTTEVLVDIIFRARPPDAFLKHISGVGVPKLR